MALNESALTGLVDSFWAILGAFVGGFLNFIVNYWVELVITLAIVSGLVFLFQKMTKDVVGSTSGAIKMRK